MMKEKKHKKLSDRDIETVCRILDGWRGKLTWEALARAVEPAFGHEFTRQALSSHDRIKAAFQIQKNRLRNQKDQEPEKDVELTSTLERIDRLEAENARLSQENGQLLLQFRRWAYNASLRGLSLEFLNQPLPEIDRERTLTLAKERRKG